MKVVALVSGGKDSCYNMMECVRNGHEIVALANLHPSDGSPDELDSHMFQTVGHQLIYSLAEAMELPLYRRALGGKSLITGMQYKPTTEAQNNKDNNSSTDYDEIEDLEALLREVITKHPDVKGVSSGAVLSSYQRIRIEHICAKLGLTSLGYLWQRDQDTLLQEMTMKSNVHAIMIKIAAPGLNIHHFNTPLRDIVPHLLNLSKNSGVNSCGEGGEYETFTLDCPLFKKRIIIDEYTIASEHDDTSTTLNTSGSVAYFIPKAYHLEEKTASEFEKEKMYLEPIFVMNTEFIRDDRITLDNIYTSGNYSFTPSTATKWCKEYVEMEESLAKMTYKLHQSLTKRQTETKLETISKATPIETSPNASFVFTPGLRAVVEEPLESTTTQFIQSLKDIVGEKSIVSHINFYVPDMKNFLRINTGYSSVFSIEPPSRACTECDAFSSWNLQSELPQYDGSSTVTVVDGDVDGINKRSYMSLDALSVRECDTYKRTTVHIQGLSHWAPANIGPYAQAVGLRDIYSYAGQIGLIPHDLSLSNIPSIQFRQMIHNIATLLQSTKTSLTQTFFGGSFFTSADVLHFSQFQESLVEIMNDFNCAHITKSNSSDDANTTDEIRDTITMTQVARLLPLCVRYAMLRHDSAPRVIVSKNSQIVHDTQTECIGKYADLEHERPEKPEDIVTFDEHGCKTTTTYEYNGWEWEEVITEEVHPFDVSALSFTKDPLFEASNQSIESTPLVRFHCSDYISMYAPIYYPIAPHLPKFSFYEFQTSAFTLSHLESVDMTAFHRLSPIYDSKHEVFAVLVSSGIASQDKILSLSMHTIMKKPDAVPVNTRDTYDDKTSTTKLEKKMKMIYERMAIEIDTITQNYNLHVSENINNITTNNNIDILWSKMIYSASTNANYVQDICNQVGSEKLGYLRNCAFIPSSSTVFCLGEAIRTVEFGGDSIIKYCNTRQSRFASQRLQYDDTQVKEINDCTRKQQLCNDESNNAKMVQKVLQEWENDGKLMYLMQFGLALIRPNGFSQNE